MANNSWNSKCTSNIVWITRSLKLARLLQLERLVSKTLNTIYSLFLIVTEWQSFARWRDQNNERQIILGVDRIYGRPSRWLNLEEGEHRLFRLWEKIAPRLSLVPLVVSSLDVINLINSTKVIKGLSVRNKLFMI